MRSRTALAVAFLLVVAAAGMAQTPYQDAQRLYDQGKYEESRQMALAILNSSPNDIDTYVLVCSDLLGLGRWADARNYALKAWAIRKDPRFLEILGEAAYNLGENDEALRHFQDYVSAVPEGVSVGTAYYYVGEIYLRLARYAHADIAFATALQFSPGNARWWTRLGWAREKGNDSAGALAAYNAALRLEPRLEDALLGKERLASSR